MKLKTPSIKEVASVLRDINANIEGACDVRLQVYLDGKWTIRIGDSSYDQDHRGVWGSSSIPGVNKGKVSRFNSRKVAKDLLTQVKDGFLGYSSTVLEATFQHTYRY